MLMVERWTLFAEESPEGYARGAGSKDRNQEEGWTDDSESGRQHLEHASAAVYGCPAR